MIPNRYECMFPLLQYLSDGKIRSLKECTEYISSYFNLLEKEKSQLQPNGRKTIVYDETGWAKCNLEETGFLETVTRGKYKITDEGILFLEKNSSFELIELSKKIKREKLANRNL